MRRQAAYVCAGLGIGLAVGAFAMGALGVPGSSPLCALAFLACMAALLFYGRRDL